MSNRSRRGVRVRAAVTLGLVVALIVVPGLLPGVPPAIAQDDEAPEVEPAAPPSTGQPSNQQPASKPSGPVPAFSPSGAGSSTGSGSGSSTGSGTGSGSGSGAPAPRSTGAGFTPPPPSLGAVTYENPLKDEKVFKAGYCFGRKAFSQYVGEGFKLRVMGPCFILLDEAWITVLANGVNVGDGEVALDFKVVDGAERATVGLYVRNVNERLIGAHVAPQRGEASLFTLIGGQQTDLGYRNHLVIPPYEWNRLALRVSGHDVWLLVNDEPVLHSHEVYADAGKIVIEVVRSGDPEDEAETAVVFRNLTLTALEGGEPGRSPTGP